MTPTPPPNLESWHLDKRIPIALILAIVAQTMAAVWWAATVSTRVDVVERRTTALELQSAKSADMIAEVGRVLAAVNEGQRDMRRALDRIERTIDSGRARPNQ